MNKNIQWNEAATSTVCTFNNSWLLYYHFSNMFYPSKVENVSNFHFEERAAKKLKFSIFLKGLYFVMDGSIDVNVGVVWETSVGFLRNVVLQLFSKYDQNYANLNVKVG